MDSALALIEEQVVVVETGTIGPPGFAGGGIATHLHVEDFGLGRGTPAYEAITAALTAAQGLFTQETLDRGGYGVILEFPAGVWDVIAPANYGSLFTVLSPQFTGGSLMLVGQGSGATTIRTPSLGRALTPLDQGNGKAATRIADPGSTEGGKNTFKMTFATPHNCTVGSIITFKVMSRGRPDWVHYSVYAVPDATTIHYMAGDDGKNVDGTRDPDHTIHGGDLDLLIPPLSYQGYAIPGVPDVALTTNLVYACEYAFEPIQFKGPHALYIDKMTLQGPRGRSPLDGLGVRMCSRVHIQEDCTITGYWAALVYNGTPHGGRWRNYNGAWDSTTNYIPNDAVSGTTGTTTGGSAFMCTAANTNVQPGVATGWQTYWMQTGAQNTDHNWVRSVNINGQCYANLLFCDYSPQSYFRQNPRGTTAVGLGGGRDNHLIHANLDAIDYYPIAFNDTGNLESFDMFGTNIRANFGWKWEGVHGVDPKEPRGVDCIEGWVKQEAGGTYTWQDETMLRTWFQPLGFQLRLEAGTSINGGETGIPGGGGTVASGTFVDATEKPWPFKAGSLTMGANDVPTLTATVPQAMFGFPGAEIESIVVLGKARRYSDQPGSSYAADGIVRSGFATHVTQASANQTLPPVTGSPYTINVASTTGFPAGPGNIVVMTETQNPHTFRPQHIAYTSLNATQFLGCTGGDSVGTMNTGSSVTGDGSNAPRFQSATAHFTGDDLSLVVESPLVGPIDITTGLPTGTDTILYVNSSTEVVLSNSIAAGSDGASGLAWVIRNNSTTAQSAVCHEGIVKTCSAPDVDGNVVITMEYPSYLYRISTTTIGTADDATTTSGSKIVTSATAKFSSADVGATLKIVGLNGAGGAGTDTIVSVESATSVTVTTNATATASNLSWVLIPPMTPGPYVGMCGMIGFCRYGEMHIGSEIPMLYNTAALDGMTHAQMYWDVKTMSVGSISLTQDDIKPSRRLILPAFRVWDAIARSGTDGTCNNSLTFSSPTARWCGLDKGKILTGTMFVAESAGVDPTTIVSVDSPTQVTLNQATIGGAFAGNATWSLSPVPNADPYRFSVKRGAQQWKLYAHDPADLNGISAGSLVELSTDVAGNLCVRCSRGDLNAAYGGVAMGASPALGAATTGVNGVVGQLGVKATFDGAVLLVANYPTDVSRDDDPFQLLPFGSPPANVLLCDNGAVIPGTCAALPGGGVVRVIGKSIQKAVVAGVPAALIPAYVTYQSVDGGGP